MSVDFVHCWACRLPCSPSGRVLYVDGLPARGEAIQRTCDMVAAWRIISASVRPEER